MKEKSKYYSGTNIRARGATYSLIFGERSNGKTFDILLYAFEEYVKSGYVSQLAMIRRWDEDFVGANSAKTVYDSLICDGEGRNRIKELTKDEYDSVSYYNGRYYLSTTDEAGKRNRSERAIAYAFSLTAQEHYKSASFPFIKYIFFDEFMTRRYYLPDEFVTFQNLISTIVRHRDDIKIFMAANTVNRYCPYFTEMGLYRIKDMKPGDIDVYTYGSSGLKVAVEYCDSPSKKKKPSDVYFAFDNPRLNMITDGSWEIDLYPHCPIKYKPKDIVFPFFLMFDRELLQGDVICAENSLFIFMHRKTSPIQDPDRDLIYQLDADSRANYSRSLYSGVGKRGDMVSTLFKLDKVFYQDNEVGEIVRNYKQNMAK